MQNKKKKQKDVVVEEQNDLQSLFDNARDYQASIGLTKNIPVFIDFFEGRQWAPATEKTKNLPRPVINIIKMICRNKESAIKSSVVRLVYKTENEDGAAEAFTNFADYISREMRLEDIDSRAIHDGVVKGSFFYHFYWDSEARGKAGKIQGGVRCELIDILNIAFANPKEKDEQKQKWIIIATRENVESVKAKMDKNDPDCDPDRVSEDETDDIYGKEEQEGSKLVTVYTKYFRIDGEVYCMQATKGTIIRKPFPLSPDVDSAMQMLEAEEDAPNNSLTDDKENPKLPQGKAYLYPIVVGNYEEREKSIYGIGEVEGLIPNQKAINFNIAMSLLAAQNNAWSKYIVTENALAGQEITNEPGQVLIDHSGTGKGISKLEGSGVQSAPIQLVNTLADLTRVVTGSTEVMTGEAISANMSGAAIAQLQSQAQQPIEDLRDRFWRVKEKQGRVLEQFFKLFYHGKEYSYPKTVVSQDENGLPKETEASESAVFNGSDYLEKDFTIVVEAIAGTKSSAAGDINMLDNLLNKGFIDKKTYVKAYPKHALTNRNEILKSIEESEQSQIVQLQQQLQQAQAQIEESAKLITQQKEVVEDVVKVIRENNELKSILAKLYAESTAKIQQGNQIIRSLRESADAANQDATVFANILREGGFEEALNNAMQ